MTKLAGVGHPASAAVADVDEIRRSFPALERRHEGEPVAYLDGPGGTQVARPVVDAMNDYLFHHNANTHWLYPSSEETDAMITASREAMADFLHASPDEIAFGQNMTSLTFHLARALGRRWSAGDEIVVTELDHHANIAPWQALAQERGVTVRMVRMIPEDGRLDWDHLEHLVSRRTRLLAIGAASNAIGTINDVKGAVELAHVNRALCFIDAVHYAPHELVDVQETDCDFLSCSAYKFYGPHIGILWGRRDLLEGLDVPKLDPAPDTAPERLETGTQNHEGIVGAGAAVDFLASLSGARPRRLALMRTFDALERRSGLLIAQAWDGLAEIDGVTLYGPPPGMPRTPTLAFTLRGRSTNDVAIALARRGVFVSNGDFYAATVIERLGQAPDGVVRVGCSCYTTVDEVERLLDAVRSLAAG